MKKGISSLAVYLEKTAAALICSNRSQVQGSGLMKRLKLHHKKARKKCGFCHIISRYNVPGFWARGSLSVFTCTTHTKWLKVIIIQTLNP